MIGYFTVSQYFDDGLDLEIGIGMTLFMTLKYSKTMRFAISPSMSQLMRRSAASCARIERKAKISDGLWEVIEWCYYGDPKSSPTFQGLLD
jgi:hypothetical protein